MKILLLGKNGQVGWELQRALQPLGDVIALDRHIDSLTGLCGDVTNFDAISTAIAQIQPNIVVNATAYTAVDQAESDVEQADLINHLAVKHLAMQCHKHQALLVHYSTDYVFSGEGTTAWQEDDQTAPIGVYAQTKRAGEVAIEQSNVDFLNFRTCWVYASRGHNFIKTMLKLAQSREELNIIADQIGVPTGAALIADVTAQALRFYLLQSREAQQQLHGHYHLAPQGETSWYEYAQFIFASVQQKGQDLLVKQVNPIATTAYPTPAKRPLNSRLNTHKLQHNFQLHLPDWKVGVTQALEEIIQ
ncbi:dTDP-4-dehydrorhamnose reductase [Acinetobacter sp. MD2]|uniref:dTDP-4-dehydrorhamnose reductase n=1 Tax=Acinetobacter sp. MD2 TaxID=2600066 RepID=UPI002D1E9F0A|nr:dTDP-4-dehydrorhamnose reductase [Acinetobacter sp. MD2]MEB3767353.1 dTDP-4-dehydrorhamnose reductase [Acinetobacter sp. MD2]